eukprot:163174-Amorphochlora_amoeboformis.AAC.2
MQLNALYMHMQRPEPSSPVVTVSEDLVATGGHEFQEPINWIAFICALLAFIVAIIQANKQPNKPNPSSCFS